MWKRDATRTTVLLSILSMLCPVASGDAVGYGVGRVPSPAELDALTVMVTTTGEGLPKGSGTAKQGKEVFAQHCAVCHGPMGEGGDGPALVGGQGTLATSKPKRTVGSYWPYATTLWDYVNRAMPFDRPGTLSHAQVYAVSAYILFLNGIVDEKKVLDAKTLARIRMPNVDGFVPDPRPDVEQ
jgi:cytochrome c